MSFRPEHFKPQRQTTPPEKRRRPDHAVAVATLQVGASLVKWGAGMLIQQTVRRHQLEGRILQLASQRMGVVSVADAVRELNAIWGECEGALSKLCKKGCCYLSVPKDGPSAYVFEQFLPRLWCCEYCDGVHLEGPTCPNCGAGLVERACQVPNKAPSANGCPCW